MIRGGFSIEKAKEVNFGISVLDVAYYRCMQQFGEQSFADFKRGNRPKRNNKFGREKARTRYIEME